VKGKGKTKTKDGKSMGLLDYEGYNTEVMPGKGKGKTLTKGKAKAAVKESHEEEEEKHEEHDEPTGDDETAAAKENIKQTHEPGCNKTVNLKQPALSISGIVSQVHNAISSHNREKQKDSRINEGNTYHGVLKAWEQDQSPIVPVHEKGRVLGLEKKDNCNTASPAQTLSTQTPKTSMSPGTTATLPSPTPTQQSPVATSNTSGTPMSSPPTSRKLTFDPNLDKKADNGEQQDATGYSYLIVLSCG